MPDLSHARQQFHRIAPRLLAFMAIAGGVSLAARGDASTTAAITMPSGAVLPPPAGVIEAFPQGDRDAARAFYGKWVDVGGLSILGHASVADEALLRAREIVGRMLAGRPDVLNCMQRNRTRLVIIGKDQVYTDLPDYRHQDDPSYWNERVRGTGGLDVTSFGEENLLNLPIDRYDDESIAVHEFLHTIDAALAEIDPDWPRRLRETYRNALAKGRWRLAYAAGNEAEYWAEIAQSYFDCNRINNWNHINVGTREQLKLYDPEGYELVRTTMNLSAQTDWRYTPVCVQPSVTEPPARFAIDPFFTKFTYARELPIIASGAVSDAALLRANETVRRLFAYRHDVLKAMINDGARLVILGRDEPMRALPQLRETAVKQRGWDNARYADYDASTKMMVVPEESLLREAVDRLAGADPVVRVLARAMYARVADRPVDPDWEARSPRVTQQYELRVQRLDMRFRDRLQALFEQAVSEKKLWQGTPAANDAVTYWASGVEAYFDATGTGQPQVGAERPITTREQLRQYDPELFKLVDETFAFAGRIDWRCATR